MTTGAMWGWIGGLVGSVLGLTGGVVESNGVLSCPTVPDKLGVSSTVLEVCPGRELIVTGLPVIWEANTGQSASVGL